MKITLPEAPLLIVALVLRVIRVHQTLQVPHIAEVHPAPPLRAQVIQEEVAQVAHRVALPAAEDNNNSNFNKMKRNLLIIALIIMLSPSLSFGQGKYDALRYSQQFYEGTARSIAMGNAFTALGGDIGTFNINPAASAVFRHSEFVITPSVSTSLDNTNYLSNISKDSRTKFNLSNMGIVTYLPTNRKSGILNVNFGVAVNKVNNYGSRTSASGENAQSSWLASLASKTDGIKGKDMDKIEGGYNPFYNSQAPWKSILAWNTMLLDTLPGNNYVAATENIDDINHLIFLGGPLKQSFYRETAGSNSEIVFNGGVNISNIIYLGVNLGVQSLYYSHYESFTEEAKNPADFQTKFENLTYKYNQTTSGYGVNLKAGMIVTPFDGLRVGASVSTPTWFMLEDQWIESIETRHGVGNKNYDTRSPLGNYSYRMTSPFRWNIGAAYVIGKVGVVSIDYENTDYSKMRLKDAGGAYTPFENENTDIISVFKSVNNLRVGGEIKVLPNISLRAGYNYYDTPEKKFNGEKHLASLGFGYRHKNGCYIDLAYQQQLNKINETYPLYSDYGGIVAPLMNNSYSTWRVLLSFGISF